jgi:hypothetical protein
MASRARNPLTPTEIKRIAELHAAGKTRNDIAKDLGRSGDTITRHCKKAGLLFDRAATAAATEARQADAAALRAELEITYLHKAKQLLAQIDQPHTAFNFGGKDNTYAEKKLDRPPVKDVRDLMQSASIATTASLRIMQAASDGGLTAARSLVEDIATAFGFGSEPADDA